MAQQQDQQDLRLKAKRILVVEDEREWWERHRDLVKRSGATVEWRTNVDAAISAIQGGRYDIVLLDLDLGLGPREGGLKILRHFRDKVPRGFLGILTEPFFVVVTGLDQAKYVVEAMRLGAAPLPVLKQTGDYEEVVLETLAAFSQLFESVNAMESDLREEIIGDSAAMVRLKSQVEQCANCDLPVLILGETGVGKGLVAKCIHYQSKRKDAPFEALDCGLFKAKEHLLASELLGHKRGAFTGAECDRMGRFELAKQGTLFLDEIGTVPDGLQPTLLGVLDHGNVTPLGAREPISVDVRIVAATNSDLAKMVEKGDFRRDLYHRLAVLSIQIPPLREWLGDIPKLVQYFLPRLARQLKRAPRTVSEAALQKLRDYAWPGNVRELRNTLYRTLVFRGGNEIAPEDIQFEYVYRAGPASAPARGGPPGAEQFKTKHDAQKALEESLALPPGAECDTDRIIAALKVAGAPEKGDQMEFCLPRGNEHLQRVIKRVVVRLLDEKRFTRRELTKVLRSNLETLRQYIKAVKGKERPAGSGKRRSG